LQYLVLAVRAVGECYEQAEHSLAPMVVQEPEISLDGLETELLEGQYHAEEHEIKIHDCLMEALHVHYGEPQCSN